MRAGLCDLAACLGTTGPTDVEELAALGAMHPSPWVRQSVLRYLASNHPRAESTGELARWLSHDYEDIVAFAAIDFCGTARLDPALRDLLVIVGPASERLRGRGGKPVGIGHALVLRAIGRIVGSDDPAVIEASESQLFPGGRAPIELADRTDASFHPPRANRYRPHSHRHMRRVPGGGVALGPPLAFSAEELLFDWDDCDADRDSILECGSFNLDEHPVTAADYDRFAASEPAWSHPYCHPAEPAGKLHVRNTLLDRRTGPDHPVTGVDWFDAYAYAAWMGKRLPTEVEWQRAAQGDRPRAYPWGDVFDAGRSHCLPPPRVRGVGAVRAWREALLALADGGITETTRPVGIAGSASPYGIQDMSGNVWEWTTTAFWGDLVEPVDMDRDALDIVYDHHSYAVLKGGAWTSLPEQASSAFRGRDMILDRHFEIGFRCACDCSIGGP